MLFHQGNLARLILPPHALPPARENLAWPYTSPDLPSVETVRYPSTFAGSFFEKPR